jgi:transposase-like protein
MARGDRDLGKEQFWRRVLRRWDGSKQTVREFCVEHGVSEPSFYSWRRIIAQRDQQSAARPISATPADDLPAFVPLTVTAPMPSQVLEVVVGPGRLIRVPTEFDSATLRRLVAVLEEEASPC